VAHAPYSAAVKLQTLIFDLDGTISDPSEGIFRCVNFALEGHGYKPVTLERVQRMIGPPLTEIFEHFLGPLPDDRMLALVESYRERYAEIGYSENIIYDCVPELIRSLTTNGYTLGICTSKRADYAASIVRMFGLDECFEFIDGGDVHIKKSMQLERLVAAGMDARSAIMIGDRAVDIYAAKANEIRSVGVSWGFAATDELPDASPDHLVHTPLELQELFL